MEKNAESILDQFDEEQEIRWFHHWSITIAPIAMLCIGMIFRMQHWPYASMIIAGSLMLLLLRSGIFFFSKKRKTHEWIYFCARVYLNLVLVAFFWGNMLSGRSIAIALVIFTIGVLTYVFHKKDNSEKLAEKQEDDY
jgi:uncharacterized membrane protein